MEFGHIRPKGYGPESNRSYRYVLLVIDIFSEFVWTIGLKNKNAQSVKDIFENILLYSERKPNLMKIDRGKDFYNNIIQIFIKNNNIKHYSRKTDLGAVFAKKFNRVIRHLLKKVNDVLPTKTKQYNNRLLSSTKVIPIQASSKENEGYVYENLLDKRKTKYSKIQINACVRTADLKRVFKG